MVMTIRLKLRLLSLKATQFIRNTLNHKKKFFENLSPLQEPGYLCKNLIFIVKEKL